MSVIKRQRKESKFYVLTHMLKVRKAVVDLCKRNFGYSEKQALRSLTKKFGGMAREELSEVGQAHWDKEYDLIQAELNWHIPRHRDRIECLIVNAHAQLHEANSIYPRTPEELLERRVRQNIAIAKLQAALTELQFTTELFPISIGEFDNIVELIDNEVNLIKRWRKTDNKTFKGLL